TVGVAGENGVAAVGRRQLQHVVEQTMPAFIFGAGDVDDGGLSGRADEGGVGCGDLHAVVAVVMHKEELVGKVVQLHAVNGQQIPVFRQDDHAVGAVA